MYPVIQILSLISLISLTLGGLTGCGEKRVHVATMSGTPGAPQTAAPQLEENSSAQISGLTNASVDESDLSSQTPDSEAVSTEPIASAINNEPINLAHEPTSPNQDGLSDSSLSDTVTSTSEPDLPNTLTSASESGLSSNDDSFAPLSNGQDISSQSSSFPGGHTSHSLANIEDYQEPVTAQNSDPMPSPHSQDFSAELQDALSGENIEPVPETLQIAKIEPANSLQDQINRIKEEEFAKTANLEDVFFEFDSWTLTQEGQLSLNRDLGRIEQDPSSNLIIEGHADQRGTQAYNMVLAKRRAAAIQDYLKQAGVDPSRLAIISYGKDKPFCQDATEVCYQLNRRGHLLIQNP